MGRKTGEYGRRFRRTSHVPHQPSLSRVVLLKTFDEVGLFQRICIIHFEGIDLVASVD